MRATTRRLFTLLAVLTALGAATGCGSSEETATGGETGQADASVVDQAEQAALDKYRWYLERKAALLVDWTKQLQGQIVSGEVGKAQSRYATSRVQYGHLQPLPWLVPALEQSINGQEDDEGSPFTGFHRIEKSLFNEESTAGLKPVAKLLVEDVQRLHHEAATAELEPRDLVRKGESVLRNVAGEMLTGEEEPYSQADLVDISASLEGVEAAFVAVRPLLTESDPDLVLQIESQFAQVYEPLSSLGSPARQPQARDPAAGAIFTNLTEADDEQIAKIVTVVPRLAESFAEAAELIQSASG